MDKQTPINIHELERLVGKDELRAMALAALDEVVHDRDPDNPEIRVEEVCLNSQEDHSRTVLEAIGRVAKRAELDQDYGYSYKPLLTVSNYLTNTHQTAEQLYEQIKSEVVEEFDRQNIGFREQRATFEHVDSALKERLGGAYDLSAIEWSDWQDVVSGHYVLDRHVDDVMESAKLRIDIVVDSPVKRSYRQIDEDHIYLFDSLECLAEGGKLNFDERESIECSAMAWVCAQQGTSLNEALSEKENKTALERGLTDAIAKVIRLRRLESDADITILATVSVKDYCTLIEAKHAGNAAVSIAPDVAYVTLFDTSSNSGAGLFHLSDNAHDAPLVLQTFEIANVLTEDVEPYWRTVGSRSCRRNFAPRRWTNCISFADDVQSRWKSVVPVSSIDYEALSKGLQAAVAKKPVSRAKESFSDKMAKAKNTCEAVERERDGGATSASRDKRLFDR